MEDENIKKRYPMTKQNIQRSSGNGGIQWKSSRQYLEGLLHIPDLINIQQKLEGF